MTTTKSETITKLVGNFLADHPEYRTTLNQRALERRLEKVYSDVLEGNYLAKSEDQLSYESQEAGIERNHYLDLVNLTAHAATNRPIEQ